jgi:hypothetical protein
MRQPDWIVHRIVDNRLSNWCSKRGAKVNKTQPGVRHRFNRLGLISGIAAVVLLAACGGATSGGGLGSGPLLVGVLAPFSGADASFGPRDLAGC